MTTRPAFPDPGSTKPGPQFLILAQIMRPHGIRGDLSIKVVTKFPERMNELEVIYVGADSEKPHKLTEHAIDWVHRAKKDQWLLHLEGVDDRDAADLLRSQYIFVSLADAVPLEDDEVYLFQIMGLQVQNSNDETIGRIVDIIETGANDVYVIQSEAYGEVLIPAISGVILDIDVDHGVMKVQLPAGLLPDQAEA
ncbi:MAG: ribosome maturation factor RimM [Chloroflexota bacterium]